MEKQSESVRDRLLARLPQPENIAAYREETASLLAKHEKALSTEHWTNQVIGLCSFGVFLMANSTWGLKLPTRVMVTCDVMAGILFLLTVFSQLQQFIYRNQVNLLKEVKQVQLQVLEVQASLRKGGDLPH
jgi:hypothetical protein